jgi:hypothetical protein
MAFLTKTDIDRVLMLLGYPDRQSPWWTLTRDYQADNTLTRPFSDVTSDRIREIFDELDALKKLKDDAQEKGLAVEVGAIKINLAAYCNSIRYESRLLVVNLSTMVYLDIHSDVFATMRRPGLVQYQ